MPAIPPRFRGVWSSEIIRECWQTLAEKGSARSVAPEAIQNQTQALLYPLQQVLALVDGANRPSDAPRSPLRDPDDEHLWNAAVNAHARYVVSHNTRDFPPPTLVTMEAVGKPIQVTRHRYHGVEFLTAIEFVEDVLGEDAATLYGRPLPAGVVRSRRAPTP